MAQLMEYADYLSKEIGPRPAGTEEEQQAALYITERFQKDSGFSAQIEEFTSTSNLGLVTVIPGLVVIVVAVLAMIFPVLSIPAFILAAVVAALFSLENTGRPIATRRLARGASQNVVARYQPNYDAETSGRARTRKIVLMAHYDSGKVTPSVVRAVESIKLPVPLGMVCMCGYILAAVMLLIHIFVNAGVGAIVVNVLTIIALVVCAWPILRAILYHRAPYNEGANNNATGTAALLEVARRISRGSVSEADLADAAEGVIIHGELAALENGLVPEGAQIVYEAEQLVPPSELGEYDAEESLLAAKAAIAAMTGQPVERRVYGSVADKLVNSRAQAQPYEPTIEELPAEAAPAPVNVEDYAAGQAYEVLAPVAQRNEQPVVAAAPEPEPEPARADGFENAPSWFVAAQQNAKKPAEEAGPVQRSRYAEAIEAAEREAAERERERIEQEQAQREAELRAREQAARAAIAQAAAEAAEVAAAPVAAEPVAVTEPDAAKPEAIQPIDGRLSAQPADDSFAESLGSTVAFQPVDAAALANEPAEAPSLPIENLPAIKVKPEEEGAPAPVVADIPEISEEPADAVVPETTSPSRSGLIRKLRVDVPSMSGVIRMQQAGQDVSQLPQQQPASAPAPMPAPVPVSAPAPEQVPSVVAASDETVDYDMPPVEADGFDSREANRNNQVEEIHDGQPEPEYVEMPKTRAGGLLGRFRRKDREELEETPQEWLDVDKDFDARTVGRERGGWESFRSDDYEDEPRTWEGGSYSRVRLGHVDMRSGEGDDAVEVDAYNVVDEDDRQIADEIEQIYHFRNPLYNTEIWFVALGSDNASHDGAKAFIAEHADELRGSMLIEVESLGAGELCVATAEGSVRPIAASSRVKRYTRTATAATGIAPGSVNLVGADSAASIMQAAGFQAMHLLGVEDGRPALKGSADDIMENVDDLLLDDNVNFLMELLKH